jgi:hypothetical protein
VVAGSILGWFVGGMATLDVPDPGHEPSDSVLEQSDENVDRPALDRPDERR